MVFVPPKDRVLEHSTSNSQTVFTVTGAVDTSFNAFSASMSVGDTTIGGVVEPGVAFKSGKLTYSAANEITIDSTGFESKGTFSAAGTKEIFMGLPAKSALMVDGGQSLTTSQQNVAQKNLGLPAIMRSYLAGLTLSTAGSSATFGIAAGVAADSTNADMMTLSSAYTKTTSAWAVGSATGSLDSGTIANNTGYYVHLIKRVDTGVVDVLTSLSATSPTLPTNYTLARRIGFMKTNGSAQWLAFIQNGDEFDLVTEIQDVAASTLTTTPVLYTLTVPAVPGVTAKVRMYWAGAGIAMWLYPPDVNTPATTGYSVIGSQGAELRVRAGSAQVRAAAASSSGTLYIATLGWIDRRGRD